MRKHLLAMAAFIVLCSPARAVDTTVSAMSAASALGGTELTYCVQGGADRKCTISQIATFVAPGTGVLTALGVNVGSAGAPVLFNGAGGTPSAIALTNGTGLPISTGLTGAGTGVLTALGVNIGSAGAPVLFNGALGTPSSGTLTNATGLPIAGLTGLGTGVATMLGTAVSVAGGSTVTIATGSSALGTSAIGSGACATAVTAAATNTVTTDKIVFTPNADITAVTGYAPVTTGGLAIYPYPTAGNVNFKVCNPTSSSITPGAVTLNWGVLR